MKRQLRVIAHQQGNGSYERAVIAAVVFPMAQSMTSNTYCGFTSVEDGRKNRLRC